MMLRCGIQRSLSQLYWCRALGVGSAAVPAQSHQRHAAYTHACRYLSSSTLVRSSVSSVSSTATSSSSVTGSSSTTETSTVTNALDQQILSFPYEVVQTPDRFDSVLKELATATSVALDLEAFCTTGKERQLGTISLLQACSAASSKVYLFDVLTLTKPIFVEGISPFLENPSITKLFFDCRRDIEALSCQMGLRPVRVLDLQLQFTALQWHLKSNSRRSGMTYVLKQVANMERQEGDAAVQTAMSLGGRPVWDVRPLPPHFLDYAADDVRHILLLERHLRRQCEGQRVPTEAVERLTACYVDHYAIGEPVTVEPDSAPAEVNVAYLERYIGPGGCCSFCGAKGHTASECFKKSKGGFRCTFCGGQGHTARTCFKKHPQMLKCDVCGQLGHTANNCFKKNPCTHCGGFHSSANCHQYLKGVSYFDRDAVGGRTDSSLNASSSEG